MNTTNNTIPIMCMGTSPVVLTETMHDDLMERKRQLLEEMCSAVEDVVECLYKEEWELFEKRFLSGRYLFSSIITCAQSCHISLEVIKWMVSTIT